MRAMSTIFIAPEVKLGPKYSLTEHEVGFTVYLRLNFDEFLCFPSNVAKQLCVLFYQSKARSAEGQYFTAVFQIFIFIGGLNET